MRQSELLGLLWRSVDFDNTTITVEHQLSRGSRAEPAKLVPPKAGSRRTIEISSELLRLLREHKMASRFKADDAYVFCTFVGRPLGQRNAHRAVSKAAERAGLNVDGKPPLSTHDLRHSAVSRWIAAGLDVEQVRSLAGHKDATTTLRVYAHEWERARRSDDIRAKIAATGIGAAIGGVS